MNDSSEQDASLRLAAQTVANTLVKVVRGCAPLRPAIQYEVHPASASLRLTLVVRERLAVATTMVQPAMIFDRRGRKEIVRALRGALEVVSTAWAYGYQDGREASEILKATEKNGSEPEPEAGAKA